MTAFLSAAAWWLVLWCSVARQPQGRQIGALSPRPGATIKAPRWRGFSTRSRKRASRHGLRRQCARGVGARHLQQHYAAHCVRGGQGRGGGLPIRSRVKYIAATVERHAPPIAGSVRPLTQVMLRDLVVMGVLTKP